MSSGTWTNSPASYTYGWKRCSGLGGCNTISRASSNSYVLQSSDVGHEIESVVTASNKSGSATATTESTAVVVPLAPNITAPPTIVGTATAGDTLTVSNGKWSNGPTSYTYSWRDCNGTGSGCTAITGATSSAYVLQASDVSHTLVAVVVAGNAGGSTSAVSSATTLVESAAPDILTSAPTNTRAPVVTGAAVQGQALAVSNGSWNGTPTSYSYQWQRCMSAASCSDIPGATSAGYVLTPLDVWDTVRAQITATNSAGSTSVDSSSTATVVAGTTSSSTGTNCAGVAGSGVVSQGSLDGCGFPSMDSTGPAAGTSFTSSSGFTASTAGKVYNGLNVDGGITITASNVTIENSNITDVDPDSAAIQIASNVTGVQIINDSIHGTNAVQSGALAFAVSYFGSVINGVTIDHTNFYNGDRILAGYGTVTNSYCLGGAAFDSSGGSLEHDECIYTDGDAPGIRAIHDTLINANPAQTAAIFVDNPGFGGGGTAGTVDVENSLLAGGDYCIYGGASSSGPAHTGPVTVTGNRFARLYYNTCGQYGPDAYMPADTLWSGNVWDDTGQALSN